MHLRGCQNIGGKLDFEDESIRILIGRLRGSSPLSVCRELYIPAWDRHDDEVRKPNELSTLI